MSTPPAGATLCGKAALTAADFLAGCNAAPTAMEQIPSRQCGEVTTTGGRWEAWCDTTGLAYLWVEVDGALPGGSCGASFLSTYSEWEVFAGAGGMSGPLPSGQQKFFTAGPPVNGALDSSVSVMGAQGKGHVWLGANLFCPMGESFPALLGFDFKWAM